MHVMIAALIRTILAHVLGLHDVLVTLVLCIIGGSVIPVIIYNLFILNNIGWFLFTFKKPKKQKANNRTATQATVTA